VEAGLLILEGISGDDGLVVAVDGDLGDVSEGWLTAEFLTLLPRGRAIPLDVDDLVVLDDVYDCLVADGDRDLAGRAVVLGLVRAGADLASGEVGE
jgi:hypothetical protein